MSNNVMTTRQISAYEDAMMDQLNADPLGSASDLKTIIDAVDLAQKINRYTQAVNFMKQTVALTKGTYGGVVSLTTITTAGTDYTVGQDLPVVDGGSTGVGATATVASIDGGGGIVTIDFVGGKGYVTPTLDLTAGTIDAVISIEATAYGAYDEIQIVDDMLALV